MSGRAGSSVGGAAMTVTSQPMILSAGISEPHTREWEIVAHDAHVQVVEGALLLPDGVQIEQRLGGMLVLAVAGVDDRHADTSAILRGTPAQRSRTTMQSIL